jgi:hypothetical protein
MTNRKDRETWGDIKKVAVKLEQAGAYPPRAGGG